MPIRTPVKFDITQLIAAGAQFDALTGWQYETPDTPCMLEVLERATAVGALSTLTSAGDTLKQDANVQAGGTAGTTPSRLNTEPTVGHAQQNQKIRVGYRNPTGGTITVDGQIILTPTGAGRGGARRAAPRRAGGRFVRRRR